MNKHSYWLMDADTHEFVTDEKGWPKDYIFAEDAEEAAKGISLEEDITLIIIMVSPIGVTEKITTVDIVRIMPSV